MPQLTHGAAFNHFYKQYRTPKLSDDKYLERQYKGLTLQEVIKIAHRRIPFEMSWKEFKSKCKRIPSQMVLALAFPDETTSAELLLERSWSSCAQMERHSSMEAASAGPVPSTTHEGNPWTLDMVTSQGPEVSDHEIQALYEFYGPYNMHVGTWLEHFRKLPPDIALSLAEIAHASEQSPRDLPPRQDPTLWSMTSYDLIRKVCEHLRSTGAEHPSAHLLRAIAQSAVDSFKRAHPNFQSKGAYEGQCPHPVCVCKNSRLPVIDQVGGRKMHAHEESSAFEPEQRLHNEDLAAGSGNRPWGTENVCDMAQASGCQDTSRKRKRRSFENDVENGFNGHSSREQSMKSGKAASGEVCVSTKDSADTFDYSIATTKQNEPACQGRAQKAVRHERTFVIEGEVEVVTSQEHTVSNPASSQQAANAESSNRLENAKGQGHKVRTNSKHFLFSATRSQSETIVQKKEDESDHPTTPVDSARELQPRISIAEAVRVTEKHVQNAMERTEVLKEKNVVSVSGGGDNKGKGSAANIKKKRARGHVANEPLGADPIRASGTDPEARHEGSKGGKRTSRQDGRREFKQARSVCSGGLPTITDDQDPPPSPERWKRSGLRTLMTGVGDARKREKSSADRAGHELCQRQQSADAHPIQQLALALTPRKDASMKPEALTVWPEIVRAPLAEAAAGFVNGAPENAGRRVIKPALVESLFESKASYSEICKGLRKRGVRFSEAELANTLLRCAQSLNIMQPASPAEPAVQVIEHNTLAKELSHVITHGERPSKAPLPVEDSDSPLSSPPATPHNVGSEIEDNHKDFSQVSSHESKSMVESNPDKSASPLSTSDSDDDEWHETEHEAEMEETGNKGRKSSSTRRRRTGLISDHFNTPTPQKQSRVPAGVCCKPFPPISENRFGIIQEKLADDPFGLYICVQFLNKTKGSAAVPIFYKLKERYPTASDLAAAAQEDVVEMIRHLGLQNQRAKKLIAIAKAWTESPPVKGRRYRTVNYPLPGDGKDIKKDEVIDDEDERRGAWEIAHLPGAGPYAIDSWRMFCRDQLRGVAQGYRGEGADEDFEPEWKRALPKDKELKACMRWMWLKEGFDWNPETGDKTPASAELMEQAKKGGIVWQDLEALAKEKIRAGEYGDTLDISKMKEEMLQEKGTREMGNSNVVEMVLPGSTPRTRKATKATDEAEAGKASDKVHVQKTEILVAKNDATETAEWHNIGTEARTTKERISKRTRRKSAPEAGESENKSNVSKKKEKSVQRIDANGTNNLYLVETAGPKSTERTSKRAKRSFPEDAGPLVEGGKRSKKKK